MEETELVTLRTEDGKWSRRVEKDDPVFSPLIPDLPGVEEIVLPRVISEIIMEEWDAYERLLAYMNYMKVMCDEIDERSSIYGIKDRCEYKSNFESTWMTYLLKGTSEVSGDPHHPPLVYLHEVSRLANLINFPRYWVLCVGVTEASPESERRRHIMTMGREYMEIGLVFDTRRGYTKINAPNSLLLGSVAMWIDNAEKEGVNVIPWREVYWGLVRNLLIRSWDNDRNSAVLDWTCVLWGDLVPLMTSYSSEEPKKKFNANGPMARASRVLAGEGTYEDPSGKGPDCGISDSDMWMKIVHLDEYYRRLLLSFPDDVDPVALGLEPVLRMKTTGVKVWQMTSKSTIGYDIHYLPIVNAIPWIHYNSLLLTSLNEKREKNNYLHGTSIAGTISLREDQFPSVVKMLANGLGKEGIRRILLSLLHYLDREGNNDRVEKFTSLLEEELERSDLSQSFQHLPRLKG